MMISQPLAHAIIPLARYYQDVRAHTLRLVEPLLPEDMVVQPMPDASPAKWHLAHTSWFFETFILVPHLPGYAVFHAAYEYLFNSYYQSVGPQFTRARRGVLSRPSVAEVRQYRAHVDAAMAELLAGNIPEEVARRIVLGLNHEQQHQELLLTDIKYLFSCNPLLPAYRPALCARRQPGKMQWVSFEEGLREIGHAGEGFAFDNEGPRHKVYVQAFSLADRLVTNGEYLAFMEAGGYAQPQHWLAEGWDTVRREEWQAPLYWQRGEAGWQEFTLAGLQPLEVDAPVSHVSHYEASAYAAWAGARLPTEAEWEVAAQNAMALRQLYGEAWQWTASAYLPYPGFAPAQGAIGEYNGKFMSAQMVLRGSSRATPEGHARATYRNFFSPATRWQFAGIRLAADGIM